MPQPLNAKEAEGAWYYEDLLELIPKKKKKTICFSSQGIGMQK